MLALTRGSSLDFPNDDPIYHNVFSLSSVANFDLGRYPRGESRARTFTKSGIVKVYCQIHSHMSATIMVFDHPYFVIPQVNGQFELANVPPATTRWSAGTNESANGRFRCTSNAARSRTSCCACRSRTTGDSSQATAAPAGQDAGGHVPDGGDVTDRRVRRRNVQVRRQVYDAVTSNLESSQRMFAALETRRQRELRAQAATIADSPTLNAALDTYPDRRPLASRVGERRGDRNDRS